jgi:hypothetical protein
MEESLSLMIVDENILEKEWPITDIGVISWLRAGRELGNIRSKHIVC